MTSLLINGHDIEPYIPSTFSDDAKERVWHLAQEIEKRVNRNLLLPFRYLNEARILQPSSLYLQNATPLSGSTITHPTKGYPFKLKVYTKGARRTVGMDGLEIMKERKSPEWWKTFHLDKIDELRLLTKGEVEGIFQKRLPGFDFEEDQGAPHGFVRNWNYWFRTFLAQGESNCDLLH